MKEKNVFNQWKLVKAQRYWRQKQIEAITEAVNAFQSEGDSKEARIFGYAAIYLAFIAQYLEDVVKPDIEAAERLLNKLPDLIGEAPVDHNLAHSLGVFEAANITGLAVAELLTRAQRALSHSTALTLGQHSGLGLPMFSNDSGEDLFVACMETSDAAVSILAQNIKRCASQTEIYDVRAENVLEFLTPSISSYANAVTMTTSARAFMKTAQLVNQPLGKEGVFENDPAHNLQTKEIQVARALAAGSAADIIIANIQTGELWNVQCLN